MQPSKYQQAIFDAVQKEKANLAVIARAGCGKSTTLIESVKKLPPSSKILVVAFNKHIQVELKDKLPFNAEALTLHSLGLRAIKSKFKSVTINESKTFELIKKVVGDKDYDLISNIKKTVSLAKALIADTQRKIQQLVEDYEIETFPLNQDDFVEKVIETLHLCKAHTVEVDFDDMIYFPFVYNLKVGKYDYVFVDEMQDLNYSQLLMILSLKTSNPETRFIVFLDDRQALYSFRGADYSTVDDLIKKLEPKKLPLPISYRCPQVAIKLAQQIVPDIEFHESNKTGTVHHIKGFQLMSHLKKGDVVISRTNAPLVKYCLEAISKGVAAKILGKETIPALAALIKKSKAKTIPKLEEYIKSWQKKETDKLIKQDRSPENVQDKALCILSLTQTVKTITELKNKIKSLFDDVVKNDFILFASVHKYKGKENDRVFMLNDTFNRRNQEEQNILYVAYTRTKNELFIVSDK
jgi:superfamily I DNA/RNA helicase